jgi:hypothetical protein
LLCRIVFLKFVGIQVNNDNFETRKAEPKYHHPNPTPS